VKKDASSKIVNLLRTAAMTRDLPLPIAVSDAYLGNRLYSFKTQLVVQYWPCRALTSLENQYQCCIALH